MNTNDGRTVVESGHTAMGSSVRAQRILTRQEALAKQLKQKHESAMVLANLLPVDRAKADETFRALREADEKRLKGSRRDSAPPIKNLTLVGRGAPYDLTWQTEIPPGGEFYGPDAATGLIGSKVSADLGGMKSMGNCVGFRYYAQENAWVVFTAHFANIHGWALASGVFGVAEVEGSCTIQVQEEVGGADIGSVRERFVHASAGPFYRDEQWFDVSRSPWVAVKTRAGSWYQVWSAIDAYVRGRRLRWD